MKIVTLSEKILKFIVLHYKDTLIDSMPFDLIKKQFPDQPESFLIKATALLADDGFVSIFDADNTILCVDILPEAIRNVEENTVLKKGYTIFKEIKNLLP